MPWPTLYLTGSGVNQDVDEATRLLRGAANEGSAAAAG